MDQVLIQVNYFSPVSLKNTPQSFGLCCIQQDCCGIYGYIYGGIKTIIKMKITTCRGKVEIDYHPKNNCLESYKRFCQLNSWSYSSHPGYHFAMMSLQLPFGEWNLTRIIKEKSEQIYFFHLYYFVEAGKVFFNFLEKVCCPRWFHRGSVFLSPLSPSTIDGGTLSHLFSQLFMREWLESYVVILWWNSLTERGDLNAPLILIVKQGKAWYPVWIVWKCIEILFSQTTYPVVPSLVQPDFP